MKKRIFTILISVIMLMSIMPATGFAALSANSFVGATVDFTNYIKNSNSNATSNKTAVATYNAGVAVDYEPVTGVFGKAADDVAVKATRITSSAEEGQIGPVRHTTRYNAAGAGDWIDLNWEWAFGDMNVERYLNVTFYTNDETSGYVVDSLSYTGNTKNNDILCVSPNGVIKFFGKTLDNNYYFETDTWYQFDIRIKVGVDTVNATADAPASKAIAYLYIDGILVGEKAINNAKDSSENITNPRGIYRVIFTSNAVQFAGDSKTHSEVTYIDNVFASVSKNDTYSAYIPALRDYTITSKTDNFITDGIHIALKNSVTVGELMEDLSYVADSVTGIKTIQIADSNRVDINDDNAIVYPGCFIHAITVSGESEHHWYRKIVNPLSISGVTVKNEPEAGENLECVVTISNKYSNSEKLGVVICIYDSNGVLKAISRKNFEASNGETTQNVFLNVPDDYDETYGIKLFLTIGSGIRILDEENI